MFKIYEVWLGSSDVSIKTYECKKSTRFYYITTDGNRISKLSNMTIAFKTLEEAKEYALEFIDKKEKMLKNSKEKILSM